MKLSPVTNQANQRGGFSSLSLCLAAAGIMFAAVLCCALVGSKRGDEAGVAANRGSQVAAGVASVDPRSWFASGRWRADARTLMSAIIYLLQDEDVYSDPLWNTKAPAYVSTNPPCIRPKA